MSIFYERAGNGEPMLLIHGLGGVGRYWDPLLDSFTSSYDVVVVDLPGFGRSPGLPGDLVSAAALAGALGELLDELQLADVHVVGHSLGGVVAFELAALGRARTVVGLAPAGLWKGESQAARSRRRLRAVHYAAAVSRPLARPFVRLTAGLPFAPLPRGLSAEAALALYDAYSSAPGFEPVLRGVTNAPFTKADRVTVPVTVVFGKRDTVILREDQRRDRLPAHTEWIEIPGAGHNVPWEKPKDILRTVTQTTGGEHAGHY
ncbi:MAG: alpha/beta fold hydrolase [Actinomycetes bacterium]